MGKKTHMHHWSQVENQNFKQDSDHADISDHIPYHHIITSNDSLLQYGLFQILRNISFLNGCS